MAARTPIRNTITSPTNGSALVGVSMTITKHEPGAEELGKGEAATIYVGETTSEHTPTNVIASDIKGSFTQGSPNFLEYWLPVGRYDLKISGEGLSTYYVVQDFLSGAAEGVPEELLAAESVSASKLKNLAVSAAKLAEGAVTAAKLAAGAVGTAALAALSVTTEKIAEAAVTAAKLAEGAVTTAKIAALAVTEAKIAAGAVTAAKLGEGGVECGVHISAKRQLWAWMVTAAGASKESPGEGSLGHSSNSGIYTFTWGSTYKPANPTECAIVVSPMQASSLVYVAEQTSGGFVVHTTNLSGTLTDAAFSVIVVSQ